LLTGSASVQNLIIPEPYEFVPPRFSRFWHAVVMGRAARMLRDDFGIVETEYVGADRVRSSLDAGHGVMLTANHCRPSDPFLFGRLGRLTGRPPHVMASWHVFMQGGMQRFLLQRAGVFSMHRELTDWRSLRCAEGILCDAKHPLIVFPEGIVSRTNDHLNAFMRGPAHIARRAARRREPSGGRVVIHPVAIRYFFEGDLDAAVAPVFHDLGKVVGWDVPQDIPLRERILRFGEAMLAGKETEYLGAPQSGPLMERIWSLLAHVLEPLEAEWIRRRRDVDVMARVKAVRVAILPGLVDPRTPTAERERLWRQIEQLYLVQQLHCYPGGYINGEPEHLLELVEHFEEDITDKVRPHHPMRAVVVIGDPIEAPPSRAPRPREDPLMCELRERMESLLVESLRYRRKQPIFQNS
jgi:1-acyl-sn-glycerol-3-phosphate acyltransferase